jgi:hypothetical protein
MFAASLNFSTILKYFCILINKLIFKTYDIILDLCKYIGFLFAYKKCIINLREKTVSCKFMKVFILDYSAISGCIIIILIVILIIWRTVLILFRSSWRFLFKHLNISLLLFLFSMSYPLFFFLIVWPYINIFRFLMLLFRIITNYLWRLFSGSRKLFTNSSF